jgi:hypothetical protein
VSRSDRRSKRKRPAGTTTAPRRIDTGHTAAPQNPWVELGKKFLEVCQAVLTAGLDWKVLVSATWAVTGGFAFWVHSVKPEDRAKVTPIAMAEAIGKILDDAIVTISGYVLLAIVLVVGLFAFFMQNRRIQQQGKELAKLRSIHDPHRASAGDRERLLQYAKSDPSTPVE